MAKYTHLKLKEDIPTPSGRYTPEKEARLTVDGKEVLYIVSSAVVDASCCGDADFSTALVPGYIVKYESTSKEGQPVSEVTPITSQRTRARIRKIIKETEHVSQVEFW